MTTTTTSRPNGVGEGARAHAARSDNNNNNNLDNNNPLMIVGDMNEVEVNDEIVNLNVRARVAIVVKPLTFASPAQPQCESRAQWQREPLQGGQGSCAFISYLTSPSHALCTRP